MPNTRIPTQRDIPYNDGQYYPALSGQERTNALLNMLLTLELLKISKGNGGEIDVSANSTTFTDIVFPDYVYSVTVTNDGANTAVLQIPRGRNAALFVLRASESLDIDFEYPVIDGISYAVQTAGNTASLRVMFQL